MAPKSLLVQNRNTSSKSTIDIKKHNQALINNNLLKRIEELSDQNKKLSTTMNKLSIEKSSLEAENKSYRDFYVQLTAMHKKTNEKLSALQQTVQNCIPGHVTMSQCSPSMLESVPKLSKFEIKDLNEEKKEKPTMPVRAMYKGIPIYRGIIKLQLKSVEELRRELRNGRSITEQPGPQNQQNENFGSGSFWWFAPEHNQGRNSNNRRNAIQNVQSSSTSTAVNGVQTDVTTVASTSSGIMDITFDGAEQRRNNLRLSSIDSSMINNVTCPKRTKRSRQPSSALDDSTSSSRPKRSATKNINYNDKSLASKLRK